MKCVLLLNPQSRSADEAAPVIRRGLERAGATLAGGEPKLPQQLAQVLAENDGAPVDRILVAGGDGTLNKSLPALLEASLPVAILPLGTANDLAHSLGIPLETAAALDVALSGRIERIDVASVNGSPFLNVATIGLGPQVTQHLTSELKARLGAVILTGPGLSIPTVLRQRVTEVELPGPNEAEFRALMSQIVRDVSDRQHAVVDLTEQETATLLNHLAGLTLMEAEKILTKALVEDGRLAADDIEHIARHKRSIVERDGLLEYYPVEANLSDVADLRGFKAWLAQRTAVVRDPARARQMGLPFPKGVLLTGVPGCGKSLSAKALANEWQLPLLRLDPSALYNKYIGETEKNFRRAMSTAERMSPVVLWIDEIEKAFSVGTESDGGVSQRLLGSFLSWLQERQGDVFVIATANDVQRLPPELVRKGRFDELFFVDLPDDPTRREIFEIHIRSRELDPATFALEELVGLTQGFSGSEIEQVVVSALYTAFAQGTPLGDAHLREAAAGTRPLSTTMSERIGRLRAWAAERTVRAN